MLILLLFLICHIFYGCLVYHLLYLLLQHFNFVIKLSYGVVKLVQLVLRLRPQHLEFTQISQISLFSELLKGVLVGSHLSVVSLLLRIKVLFSMYKFTCGNSLIFRRISSTLPSLFLGFLHHNISSRHLLGVRFGFVRPLFRILRQLIELMFEFGCPLLFQLLLYQ